MVWIRRFDMNDDADRRAGLDVATTTVSRGELVVLPTDTVYGLGTDAFSPEAVAGLLAAKGRGRNMPVPVLIGTPQTLSGITTALSTDARALVEGFWPGGLTLVARVAPSLQWDLGDTGDTVAVRMPLHPVALELLVATGPMAVSSANRTGMPPPTTVDEAVEQLGESVAIYLDGGPSGAAVPSTIVDVSGPFARVLRVGEIPVAALREVVADLEAPEDPAE